jgi:hypothetical protein
MHFNQMQAFHRGLSAGIIYPRWDEETHGFGAPVTSFYPPGAYYITSAFYFLTRDWLWAWAGFYWLAMLASAAALYFYARQSMSRAAAIVAAGVYVFAPYHLINQYQRGAMAEFMSFVWMPLLLFFAERLLEAEEPRHGRLRSFAALAASFGAFLWSHPPTAYQLTLVFGSCLAVRGIRRKRWMELGTVACALIFGSMMAAAYFYPAVAEQRLVNYDDVERTWPYHASYVFDYTQKVYDHGGAFFSRIDLLWAFNAIAITIGSAALLSRIRERWEETGGTGNRELPPEGGTTNFFLWTSAGLIACFLMTRYSEPVGKMIPKIENGVFSWRMLALTSLSAALLTGACAQAAFNAFGERRRSAMIICAAASGLILFATLGVSARYVAWPVWRQQAFEPNPEHYNYATLPRGAPRNVPQMEPVQLASSDGSLVIERWTPEFRRLTVEVSEPDRLQFRTFNFAGWKATIDGREAPIVEGESKNIVVDVPEGKHVITLEFGSTPVRRASNWITIISSVLLVSLIIVAKWRRR